MKFINMKFTVLILTLLGILQGCNYKGKIVGNEELIKRTQKVISDYTKISLNSSIDIVLTDGEVGNITMEAESNLIDFIDIENRSGILYVGLKKNTNISIRKKMVVYIPVDKLSSIRSSGSGDIYVKKDLDIPDFTFSNSGSGDIIFKKVKAGQFTINSSGSGDILVQNVKADNVNLRLSGSNDVKMEIDAATTKADISGSSDLLLTGKTQNFTVDISGSSDIKVDKFIAENVEVSVSGSGTIALFANQTISASVSGSGDIYYKGNAQLISSKVSGSGTIKKL